MNKRAILILAILIYFLPLCKGQAPSLIWSQEKFRSIGRLIAKDGSDNVIVCGTYGNDFAYDWAEILTIKYDTNGNELWSRRYADTINGGINRPFDIAIDDLGSIYVAGSTHETNDGLPITPEILLLKYDSNGNLLWKQEYGDSSNFQGWASKLVLRNNSEITLAGFGQLISGSSNKAFIARYDSSGQQRWIYIQPNIYETFSRDVEVDKAGFSYLCGTTACCTPGYKMFVTKFDSIGNIVWNKVIRDSTHIYIANHVSCIDDSANIYLSGETQDTLFSTGYDCATVKVDSAGSQIWFSSYTNTSDPNEWESSNEIVVDSSHCTYIVGTIMNSPNNDGLIIKNNSNGSLAWGNRYNGTGNGDDGFNSIFFTSNSNIVVTGAGVPLPNTNGLCLFLYDSTGTEIWRIEKVGNYNATNSVEINNSIYTTGQNGNIDLSWFDDSLFLFKFGDTLGLGVISNFDELPDALIFPNPFCDYLNISFPDNSNIHFYLSVFNIAGELVFKNYYTTSAVLFTKDFTDGVYLIKLNAEGKQFRMKVVKQ